MIRRPPRSTRSEFYSPTIFGFAGLSNYTWTIEVLDPWNENCPDDDPAGNYCAYDRFVALKETNPALKTILAVGGWNEGSTDYSDMAADPAKRASFISSTMDLLLEEGFDGLDMDWEYPGARGGVPVDKENFDLLLDELRVALDEYGLMMSCALAAGQENIDGAYDIDGLVRNLDIFSIMSYDYHGAWENFTHHNAPLCGYPGDSGETENFSVEWTVNYWLSLGAPPEKTVMGVPLYGRCYTLADINQHTMLSPADGAGEAGPYTRLKGSLGYNEICERLKDSTDCTKVLDPLMYEPYMWCNSDVIWCGYDDHDSVALKAQFAKRAGLAGLVFWTIDTDDFIPSCGDREFDITLAAKEAFAEPADPTVVECDRLNGGYTLPATTPGGPDPTVPVGGTTSDPSVAPDCSANPGQIYYPHADCDKFWECVNSVPVLEQCPAGTYFNPESNVCDFPDNVDTSNCNEV